MLSVTPLILVGLLVHFRHISLTASLLNTSLHASAQGINWSNGFAMESEALRVLQLHLRHRHEVAYAKRWGQLSLQLGNPHHVFLP
jgi:hypothetical protein